jgi:hypothetical protein
MRNIKFFVVSLGLIVFSAAAVAVAIDSTANRLTV